MNKAEQNSCVETLYLAAWTLAKAARRRFRPDYMGTASEFDRERKAQMVEAVRVLQREAARLRAGLDKGGKP